MPTKRTRLSRNKRADLDPAMRAWFADEATAPVEHYFLSDAELRALWDAHKADILAAWVQIAPGTRPRFWWAYNAPEQRKRLGGTGTPAAEVTALALSLTIGIPDDWVKVDPSDPPIFESQASYLKRNRLLHEREGARLTAADFQPETLPVDLWPTAE